VSKVCKSLPAERNSPATNYDLMPSEQRFVAALHQLGFGRLVHVGIRDGELVLNPAPTAVQVLKFGSAEEPQTPCRFDDFELKKPMSELFEYIRGVKDGEIRCLEVRHGLPFSMEIEYRISRGMPDVKGEHVEAV
jgi:hypothetical protein